MPGRYPRYDTTGKLLVVRIKLSGVITGYKPYLTAAYLEDCTSMYEYADIHATYDTCAWYSMFSSAGHWQSRNLMPADLPCQ